MPGALLLGSAHFDDVLKARPEILAPGFGLVADDECGTVTGTIDITVKDQPATIDTVAVHPDHQPQGIGHLLLAEALSRVSALGVPTPGRVVKVLTVDSGASGAVALDQRGRAS